MRKTMPRQGDIRLIRKFVWFPKPIYNHTKKVVQTVWLEKIWIRQVYIHGCWHNLEMTDEPDNYQREYLDEK